MNQSELELLEAHINKIGKPDEAIQSDSVKSELFSILQAVPQIGVIDLEDAKNWVTKLIQCPVKGIFGEEHMLWHAKRLNGIGGSEIGSIIAHQFDYDDPFTSRMDIIKDKLMMTPPTDFSEHTLRGNLLEGVFEETAKARIAKHTKGFEPIENFQTVRRPEHPWLIGNPDFPYYINGKSGKKLFIDDFKIPMSKKCKAYAEGELPFGYISQVHHYALCAGDEGRDAGLGLLSYDFGLAEPMITSIIKRAIELRQFDTLEAKINEVARSVIQAELDDKALNIYGAGMHREKISPSEDMFNAILEEGDIIWDLIQQGYDYAAEIEHDRFDSKTGSFVCEGDEVVAEANYIALLKKTADHIYSNAKKRQEKLSQDMGKVSSTKKVSIGVVALGMPSKIKFVSNHNRAVELLKHYKVDTSEVSKIDDKLLMDRLLAMMGQEAFEKSGAFAIKEGSRVLRFPTVKMKAYKDMKPQIDSISMEFNSLVANSFAEYGIGSQPEDDIDDDMQMGY